MLIDPDTREQLTMAVNSTEVRDELGAAVATVSVMQDVSRLRELERRRIEQILFDSEKLAATGRLAASIAHEINNPLEAIKNSLYLLTSKTPPDDPNLKFLQIATKETDRVSRILRQMLGFYRSPKMEPTELNRLIEDAEGLIEKHLRQHRVRVENDLDPHLPPVIASPDQIKQVLLNLMLNAQQAMPDGGTIFVSTRVSQWRPTPSSSCRTRCTSRSATRASGIAEEHVRAHLRAVLLDQGRKGHRARPVGVAGHRPGARRLDQSAQPRRPRHHLQRRPADRRPDRRCRRVSCWSSTTRRASPSPWAPSWRWTATTSRRRSAARTR